MDISAEKNKLIEWITSLHDVSILDHLKSIKENTSKDWWTELPSDVKKSIEEGIKDAEEGRVTPHDDVMRKFKKRVNL